jgi:DNA-binding LacI/PurR family transcriptional regulator
MNAGAGTGRTATIRDVAARAGVSTATVSRALRGGVGVDPATRARVEAAARELRYRPSGIARSLKLRSTRTLGLIVTDIENPYFPQIIRAVEDAARARGYSVVLADGRRDPDREIQSLELLAARQVDGLLIASSALTERHRSWIDERPCPVVVMNSSFASEGVPSVLSDNVAGGRLAAEHLLDLGHRSLTYVATPASGNLAVDERLAGVREALAERGRSPDDLDVVLGDGGVDGGERAGRGAFQRRPETTALICYNDLTAVGALRAVHALGMRVPEDVSVVGFDDIELAPYVEPPLTTVRQDTTAMGAWAVDTLLGLIVSQRARPGAAGAAVRSMVTPRRIPVHIVVRGTTGPARRVDAPAAMPAR